MSASISTKKGSIGMAYMKRAAGLVQNAAGEYFKDAMPVTAPTIAGAAATIGSATQKLANTAQSVFPKLRQLRSQMSYKNLEAWFLAQEDEYGDAASMDANMNFDIDGLDEASITESQIADWDKNAAKVSKSIVESSHKMVEAQMVSTANISTSIDKQSAIISAGFDTTNKLLGQLLEVMTKNTATLIEATVAQNEKQSAKDSMLSSGKFNLDMYKKVIGKNFENSELAALTMIPQMMAGGQWKQFATPEAIVGGLFNFGINKAAPNLKKNMRALDDAVNSVIMTSLIRLGENHSMGAKGILSRLFGVDASRKNVDTSRSSLQIKSVAWDTISREALTNALPGYMRQILIQLGGPDMVYDYRARTFRSKKAIKKEFNDATTSTGNLARASNRVRSGLTGGAEDSADMQMLYDLMMNDLGSNYTGGSHRDFIKGLRSERDVANYVRQLTSGMQLTKMDLKTQDQFIKNLANTLKDEWAQVDIANQAASSEVIRRQAGENYAKTADMYNIDLSEFQDSAETNRATIISQYGRKLKASQGASVKEGVSALKGLSGTDYTNRALYEIYRRLETGINVFKVGEFEQLRHNHYTKKKALKPPIDYRPSSAGDKDDMKDGGSQSISGIDPGKYDNGTNLLKNNQQEDGTTEDLTKGQRFARWGKNRGKQFAGAMFSGNPEDIKSLFGAVVKDITDVAGGEMKKGIDKINDSFGNVSGYLKHKMFGTEYSYQTTDKDGKPVTKTIEKNEKGGLFGFVGSQITTMFNSAKNAGKDWFKEVRGYFDFGDKSEDADVVSKRKKLLGASIGAFAGAGFLGGPIGLMVGGLAGSALTSFGFGKKIKDFLFGTDENGKPTGLLSKTADAIISPIQYQVGKTVAFAGAMLKKNIFGPLSDLGITVKDRIENHVRSIFDEVKEAVLGPFKTFGKWMLKGVGKVTAGIANIGHKFGTTIAGSAARGAIGAGTGSIGFLQNHMAKKISKNSFHKLKKGELYPLPVGQRYYDPNEETADKHHERSMVHILTEDNPRVTNLEELGGKPGVLLNGDDEKEWRPYARDYLKWRRKQRNQKIDDDLKNSSFYKKGGYKEWHKGELSRRKELKDQLAQAMAESEKVTAEATQEISDTTADIRDTLHNEIIPGSSFKTHDQGLWDRMDIIIKTLTGMEAAKNSDGTIKKEPKKSKSKDVAKKDEPAAGAVLNGDKVVEALAKSSENNERDQFATTAMGAAITASTSDADLSKEEQSATVAIVNEAEKKDSNKRSIGAKLKDLLGLQKKRRTEENGENGEKKKSIFEKIFDLVGSGFSGITSKLGWLGGVVGGLLAFDELKSLWDNVFKGDKTLAEWWDEDSKIGKGIEGLMEVSKFVARTGGPIVKAVGKGIEGLTSMIPFMPTISPPEVNTEGPFGGLAVGILGGMYLKGASAIGSVASAAASMLNAGSNALGGGGSWKSKLLKTGAVALAAYSYLKGPEVHDHTDAAGNEIIDEDKTRGMRMPGTRVVANAGIKALANRASNVAGNGAVITAGKGMIDDLANAGVKAGLDKNGKVYFSHMAGTGRRGRASAQAAADILGKNSDETVEAVGKALASQTDDVATSKGAMGFVKKAFTGIKNFLMKNKTFAKFANAISKKIDDILIAIGKNADKIISKMPKKIAAIITKGGTKDAAGAATAGIGYAVMAFGGALSGGLSAANIFGVRESDVNGTMRTVASVIVAMLNAVPGLWALELADIFIAPLTVRSIICQLLYGFLGGKEDLLDKQATFSEDLNAYNTTYGAELDTDEYNDMVNKGMFAKLFGRGGVRTDENGRAMFDEAGEVIRTNHGVAGWFAGGQKVYAHDASGAVLRDENGKAVQAVDKYGRGIVEKKTWTDHIGDGLSAAGRWLFGGKEYETDENGQAIRDENGNLVEKSSTKNVFSRAGAAVADWWGGKEITNPDGTTTKTTGFKDAAAKTLGNIGATIAKPFKDAGEGLKNWWSGDVETDENGKPIVDENGNPIRKGGFKQWAGSAVGKVTSTIAYAARGVKATMADWVMGEYERDENGDPILDENGNPIRKGGLAGLVKSGLGQLNTHIVKPLKDSIDGAKSWIKEKADWIGEGFNNAKDWLGDKASKLWTTVSTPVKDAFNGAKNWLSNSAQWLGDKAANAGAWISEKASSAWTAISTPVKDMASSASKWVKEKAGWVVDKAKDAGAWIADKAGTIFSSITDNVKGLAKGASDWVKDKADWVKDGAKSAGDWIAKQAKSAWDWFTKPFKDLVDRGEQDERDAEAIADARGGPIGGPTIAGVGGPEPVEPSTSVYRGGVQYPDTSVKEGGNPLNKAFGISSKYGWRTLDKGREFHSGIDMYPTDGSRQASVGARFNGEVVSVKSNLPDSHTGLGVSSETAGNYVIYKTNSGMTIKNFHLKANSIPTKIKPGAKISIGDKIGEMGTTGRSTGPHLHYQMESPNAKDPKGNHTFDPTSSVNGGTTISNFNDDGSGTYSSDDSYSSGFSSDGSSSIADMANGKTGLAGVFEVLKNWGKAILNKITGGLFGDDSSSSSSSSFAGADGANLDGAMSLTGAKVNSVEEFLAMVAKEIGTTENPPNSNRVKYNDWFWGQGTNGPDYPWCMAFVQWCFHQAGLDLECKTAGCGTFLSTMQKNHPNLVFNAGTGMPKPGDIAIFGDHQHTGIIEKVTSNSDITTIEGNTSSGSSGSQDNGGCVARKHRTTSGSGSGKFNWYIRAVDFEGLKASAALHSVEGDEEMYKYLRSIGYTPEAATAIVACWAHESTNSAKTVEGDFTSYFKNFYKGNYDAIESNIPKFNEYTEGIISLTPRANPSGYRAKDGKKYAGLGYAQWTADRSKGLLDFAKKNNIKWYDAGTQLAFMDQEMHSSYRGTYDKVQNATNIDDATHAFAYGYEHGSMPGDMYSARLATARSLYPKFKALGGPLDSDDPTGGPMTPTVEQEISQNQSCRRIDPDYSSKGGVGGPTSNISTTRFGRRAVGGPEVESPTSSYKLEPKSIAPTVTPTDTGMETSQDKSLDGVISMMSKILQALVAIQQNTGTSSDLLGSLNEKDFVDKGLRESINAAGKATRNYSKRHTSSGTNATQVVSLARP